MPFRRHFARKEAREHAIAQAALQRGDIKEWHKHEAKAHRAGRHARSGLLHTEYTSFKENIPPMSYPMPYPVEYPMPVPVEEPPVLLPTTQSAPLMPLEPMAPYFEEQLAPNTIVEMGNEMEPTIIMEPTLIEEPTTIQEFVEYGEPMAPVTYIDELAQLEAYMDSQAAVGYTDPNAIIGSPILMEGENVVYGEPQFVQETVVTSL